MAISGSGNGHAGSHELLASVLDNTHLLAAFLNPKFDFIWVNRAYAKSSSKPPSFFPGKNHFDLYPHAENQAIFQRVVDTGQPFFAEAKPFEYPDQPERGITYWDWGLVPVKDQAGAVAGLVLTLAEVTGRIRAEQKLRASEETHRALVSALPDVVARFDRAGKCSFISPNAGRLCRFQPDEWLGKSVREMGFSEAQAQKWESAAQEVFAEGQQVEREFTCETGQDRGVFDCRFVPQFDEQGAAQSFIVVARDITQHRAAERENEELQRRLDQARKMESIGRLAGGVAHDFNNLLTVINGYCGLLLARLDAADPVREAITEVSKAGERAAALTRQLLAFSRKQLLYPRRLDVRQVVQGMHPLLERLLGEDIELKFALCSASGMVRVDPHQLEQVIMNLAVNARDAMPGGGTLLIETALVEFGADYVRSHPEASAGRFVMLAVTDSGRGMDGDTRRRIFEPFFTTKEPGEGTGLGLATVQGVVGQSGGFINVYSEPGMGTTFKIYLPALHGELPEEEPPEEDAATRGSETVLVLEDQAEVRDYAAASLRAYGYRVLTAGTAAEALWTSEREAGPIQLLLTDVVMPHASGRELAEQLRKLRPGIKVLYMSGYTENVIAHHGVLDRGTSFLQKPFSPETLARKVRAVLDAPKKAD